MRRKGSSISVEQKAAAAWHPMMSHRSMHYDDIGYVESLGDEEESYIPLALQPLCNEEAVKRWVSIRVREKCGESLPQSSF